MTILSPESPALSSMVAAPPWLSLVGLGEDGRTGLSPEALAALDEAEIVFGGERHLGLIGSVPGEARAWPQPFRNALPAILAERGRRVCVLATSDPFHYGIGAGLTRAIPAEEMRILPQLSSFSMACTRMRWPQEECALVSLHGRALQKIIPHLQPDARILALSWDSSTPAAVAALLTERGLGASALTVMESLGGPKERVRATRADGFAFEDIVPLNLIAVEVVASPQARILPVTPGLGEDWFAHDGQITKADIRAITLSALAPRAGEMLWDVGAGSGSIGLEWCLRHPRNRAVAFEAKPDRADRILRNRVALGAGGGAPGGGPPPRARGLCRAACPGRRLHRRRHRRGRAVRGGVGRAEARRPARRQCRDAGGRGETRAPVWLPWRLDAPHRHQPSRARRRDERLAGGDAGDAMARGEAVSEGRLIAGIGLRPGTSEAEIADCLERALAAAGLAGAPTPRLATLAARGAEPGLLALARARAAELVAIPDAALKGFEASCATRSTRIASLYGVGSVAEAAALAAAGPGGVLIQPRIATMRVTCALARAPL